jgi:hypothetical protein
MYYIYKMKILPSGRREILEVIETLHDHQRSWLSVAMLDAVDNLKPNEEITIGVSSEEVVN